jgi:hypothetical protein
MPGRWWTQSPASTSVSLVPYMNRAQPFSMSTMWNLRLVSVPARALLRCLVRLDQLGDDPAAGRGLDAEVLVEEEVAQAAAAPRRVRGLDVGKDVLRERFGRHGRSGRGCDAAEHA